MSGKTTKTMIKAYEAMSSSIMFLTGFCRTPKENFYDTEEVEVDILSNNEDVSIVVEDLSTGARMNADDIYANKGFKPPIHKEGVAINSFDLLKRDPGDNPFESREFRFKLIQRIFRALSKVEAKIRRAIELQVSQVLQTGKLTLINEQGVALYSLDFGAKVSHFPTAGVSWDTATGQQMMDDISALAEVIRDDGLVDPGVLVFGTKAFEKLISSEDVQKRLDTRRIDLGSIFATEMRGKGGTYRGSLDIGSYRYEIWTYNSKYTHPQTKVKTNYIDPNKVVVMSTETRIDGTFGAIPNIAAALGERSILNKLPELPRRIGLEQGAIDLHPNAYLNDSGDQLFATLSARPLVIPTAIDTYGCLDTNMS